MLSYMIPLQITKYTRLQYKFANGFRILQISLSLYTIFI